MKLSRDQLHELARLTDAFSGGWPDKRHDEIVLRKHRDGSITVRISRNGKLRTRITLPWRGNGTAHTVAGLAELLA